MSGDIADDLCASIEMARIFGFLHKQKNNNSVMDKTMESRKQAI